MKWIIKKIGYYMCARYLCLKNNNIQIRHNARVNLSSKFEGNNRIGENTYFRGELGMCSYIGPDSLVIGRIGRFCSIARDVRFLESTHPTEGFVSTSPAFYSLGMQCGITFVSRQKYIEKPLLTNEVYPFIVGNDVYIGAGATIIGPRVIGDGAIIAANATVTHDVEPYTIVGGTPAKVIKKRFSESEITFLQSTKWWENDLNWFKKNGDAFESLEALKNLFKED